VIVCPYNRVSLRVTQTSSSISGAPWTSGLSQAPKDLADRRTLLRNSYVYLSSLKLLLLYPPSARGHLAIRTIKHANAVDSQMEP